MLPMPYLSLPLLKGWLTVMDWRSVKEKLERRLEGWKTRVLNKGGC